MMILSLHYGEQCKLSFRCSCSYHVCPPPTPPLNLPLATSYSVEVLIVSSYSTTCSATFSQSSVVFIEFSYVFIEPGLLQKNVCTYLLHNIPSNEYICDARQNITEDSIIKSVFPDACGVERIIQTQEFIRNSYFSGSCRRSPRREKPFDHQHGGRIIRPNRQVYTQFGGLCVVRWQEIQGIFKGEVTDNYGIIQLFVEFHGRTEKGDLKTAGSRFGGFCSKIAFLKISAAKKTNFFEIGNSSRYRNIRLEGFFLQS